MRLAFVLVMALVALAAGCGGGDGGETDSTPTTPTDTDTGTSTEPTQALVRVYLVQGEKVGPVARLVDSPGVLAGALRELFAGPTAEERGWGFTSAVPEGVELFGVSVSDGTATVNLGSPFDDGGGSAGMFLRLAQLVHTATQFPTVKRIALQLRGERVTVFSSEGIELPETLARTDVEDQAPAILVESPLPGDEVTSPLRVRGTANTFEATVEWALRDAAGTRLVGGFTTATCGTGCRGTFAIEHALPGTGPATLRVFERSAKDGSVTKLVEIPLVRVAG
jgi:hypothetical protein